MDGLEVYIKDADGNVVAMQKIGTATIVNPLTFGGVEGASIEIRKDPAKTDTVISLAEVVVNGRQRVYITSAPSAAPSVSLVPTEAPTPSPSAFPTISSAPSRSTPAVLLSQGKPASQKCNYGSYYASKAVDGVISNRRPFITHTCATSNAWWKVDLLATKEIDRVQIWNRPDCCQFRLSNFFIRFLDDSGNEVNNIYHEGSIPWSWSGSTFYPDKKVYARYVQIQLTSNLALHMIEVKAFGWDL